MNNHVIIYTGEHEAPKVSLSRTVFNFILMEWHGMTVFLDATWEEVRASPRHKWTRNNATSYSRISNRDTAIKVEPEIPDKVKEAAVCHFQRLISFKRWKE